jgi:protein-disulfide isomerase
MLKTNIVATLVLAFATTALVAQGPSTKRDILKPPKGAKVAIVVFEDMQCPDCRRAHPLVKEAAKKYNIPVVTYDFPLPQHNWAFDAAVLSRYLETQSKELNAAFRDYIFENQPKITRANWQQHVDKFVADQKIRLPFLLDPDGKLAAAIKNDISTGKKVGIQHTPTIYIVGNAKTGSPFVEVVDRPKLQKMIEDMQKASQ